MTLLIFGRTGQVARELARLRPDAVFLDRTQADLAAPQVCAEAIRAHAPSGVINAAAYTAVDRAEEEEALATRVNCDAPGAMAQACAQMGIPFVHISTDYVFDGAGQTPFAPDHPTAPLGAYGRSKLAGEQAIAAAGGSYAILRTSWVFSAHGHNFVKTMLKLGDTRDRLSIVADQVGGPTPAADIAKACLRIVAQMRAHPTSKQMQGIFHFSGAPDVSWADFARCIFAKRGLACDVEDIPGSAYPTPATRPMNSRLECTGTHQAFGLGRPDWRIGLDHVLSVLKQENTL